MRGERPYYEDGDYICPICLEPWDGYGVRIALKGEVSDMTKEEAEKFMKGEGCPCCPSRLKRAKETLDRYTQKYLSHDPRWTDEQGRDWIIGPDGKASRI